MMLRCIVRFLDIYSKRNITKNVVIQEHIPWLRNILLFLSMLKPNRISHTTHFLFRCRKYNDTDTDDTDTDTDDTDTNDTDTNDTDTNDTIPIRTIPIWTKPIWYR